MFLSKLQKRVIVLDEDLGMIPLSISVIYPEGIIAVTDNNFYNEQVTIKSVKCGKYDAAAL